MVATCPECHTRYRVPEAKLGPKGVRIRCARCQAVFWVERPEPGAEPAEKPAAPPPRPEAARAPAAAPAPAQPAAPAAAPRRVPAAVPAPTPEAPAPAALQPPLARCLVAEPDEAMAQKLVAELERRRIAAKVVPEGGPLLLRLLRGAPDLVIVGSRLPGLPGAMFCEIARRIDTLRQLPIIRIGSLEEPSGAPEFEASCVLEPASAVEKLGAALAELGLGAAPPEAPAAEPSPRTGVSPGGASDDPRVKDAERLARIIVSDIVLYNEAKFRAAASSGNVADALKQELGEAGELFRQRVPEEVRAGRDFLAEELESRARQLKA